MKKKVKKSKMKKNSSIGLKVLAIAVPPDDRPGAYHIVQYEDIDDKLQILAIPSRDVGNLSTIKKHLIDNRFPCTNDIKWKKIKVELNKRTKKRATVASTPGFVGDCYLLPNGKHIGSQDQIGPFLMPEEGLILPKGGVSGNIGEWKENVAIYALNSSRLMLALCAGFSGYLLRVTGMESGGFHFFSNTSTGKSTCLYLAVSIQGPRDCLQSWSVTDSAIELLAAGYCDNTLPLDELQNLEEASAKAANLARKIAYKLTSEKGKLRFTNLLSAKHQNALNWRVSVLSTGEISLAKHAKKGGNRRMQGEEVRLVDVPANAGQGKGVFESLPEGVQSANQLAQRLDRNTAKYFGTAQLAFLQKLVKGLQGHPEKVQGRMQKRLKHFLKVNNVNEEKGYDVRIANRFALAYAAGVTAVKYQLLPFTEADVMEGISRCYQAAVDAQPVPMKEQVATAKEMVINALRTKKLLDIRKKEHGYTLKELKRAYGYKTTVDGTAIRALTKKTLKKLVANKRVREQMLKEFSQEGQLVCDASGNKTRQIPSRIANSTMPRAYCFRLNAVNK